MTAGPIGPVTPLSPSATPVSTAAQPGSANARRAAMASFIGSTLEYYDFFIYGSASALIFNKIFFPGIDPSLGMVLSMATIGIGYVVRPVAAGVIGHFGDRVGRRQMLVLTLVLMGIATFLIGCLPPASAIGAAAPVLLVFLRAVQGASAAGESVGAVTMTMEHAPSNKRAFYASWVNTGAVAGIMLASLAFLAVSLLPEQELLAWGWRLPFLASLLVVGIGLYIRLRLPESEVFEAAKETGSQRELPIKVVLRDHWATILKVILFGLWSVVSSVFAAFGLAYAGKLGVPAAVMLTVTIVTAALGIVVQPYAGILADRIGRKPVFITGNIICAVAAFAFFWSISIASVPLIFATAILFMTVGYGMVNPLGPSMTAEMFETRIRYTGAATASQLGLVVTGFAPAIAAGIVQPGPVGWLPVAMFTAACCLISALVTAVWVKETYRTRTEDLGRQPAATA
ncbi:MFS transporter [Arthrobacter sp. NQ4]|uniref:MFS transporter n=1 Tax=Arthrobacter sp. NQ4 TaxID=3027930 RepID=UPI0023B1244D|nr:MFS transporter [Arthrobacter sp. NQ4]MDE8589188.1 MFS transporter [Arthrobacter sp. NQ4]